MFEKVPENSHPNDIKSNEIVNTEQSPKLEHPSLGDLKSKLEDIFRPDTKEPSEIPINMPSDRPSDSPRIEDTDFKTIDDGPVPVDCEPVDYEPIDLEPYVVDDGPVVFDPPVNHESFVPLGENSDVKSRTPENHGEWDGERGNSKWCPDRDYIPPEKSRNPDNPYSNPDKLSWGEILDKYGIDGIEFKNGFPDFSEISKGTVEIDDFETGGSDAKDRNFKRADIALAKQRGCTPEEVKEWREKNNYTWHECEDKRTMQKVPNEVHANVPHDGGRSQ